MTSIQSRLQKEYKDVFDAEDKVKVCGRKETIDLIETCYEIAATKNIKLDFGNAKTGFMNIENIKNFYKIIMSE